MRSSHCPSPLFVLLLVRFLLVARLRLNAYLKLFCLAPWFWTH
jgi:hypothetical protein